MEFHGITELPVTGEISLLSTGLPPIHNDPCDRIIIATGQVNQLKILTCDKLISQYTEADVIW